MDIDQLKSLLVIVKYPNFTDASYELCMSQSSVSKLIGKVEREIGVRLFDRTPRGIRLTLAGEEFIKYAQQLINLYEKMRTDMKEYCALERGHLTIGSISEMGRRGLTSIVAGFFNKYPGIQLDIIEKLPADLFDLLRIGKIEAAFVCMPSHLHLDSTTESMFTVYPLWEDDIVMVTNKSHRFAKKKSINLSEAKDEPFVFIERAFGLQVLFENAGYYPKIIFESSQNDTILGLVAEGLGISLISSCLVDHFPNVAVIPLNDSLKRITALIVPKQPHLSDPLRAFINHSLDLKVINLQEKTKIV